MLKETCYFSILKTNYKLLVIIVLFLNATVLFSQSKSKFKVVLDAGHGGKDYGNVHHGYVEKKIALAVTLKVGEYLSKDSDFDFFYSRKTDVFVELKDRAAPSLGSSVIGG